MGPHAHLRTAVSAPAPLVAHPKVTLTWAASLAWDAARMVSCDVVTVRFRGNHAGKVLLARVKKPHPQPRPPQQPNLPQPPPNLDLDLRGSALQAAVSDGRRTTTVTMRATMQHATGTMGGVVDMRPPMLHHKNHPRPRQQPILPQPPPNLHPSRSALQAAVSDGRRTACVTMRATMQHATGTMGCVVDMRPPVLHHISIIKKPHPPPCSESHVTVVRWIPRAILLPTKACSCPSLASSLAIGLRGAPAPH